MQRSHIVDIECNWKNNQASLTFFSFSCILVYFFCLVSLILSHSCQISFNFFQQNSPWPAITCLYFKFIFISERNIFLNKEYEQLLSEICFISKYFPKADSLYFYCYTILLFFFIFCLLVINIFTQLYLDFIPTYLFLIFERVHPCLEKCPTGDYLDSSWITLVPSRILLEWSFRYS